MSDLLTTLRTVEAHIDRCARRSALETLAAYDASQDGPETREALQRLHNHIADPNQTLSYLDRLIDYTIDTEAGRTQSAEHYEQRAAEYDAMAERIHRHANQVTSPEGRAAVLEDAKQQRELAARMRSLARAARATK